MSEGVNETRWSLTAHYSTALELQPHRSRQECPVGKYGMAHHANPTPVDFFLSVVRLLQPASLHRSSGRTALTS